MATTYYVKLLMRRGPSADWIFTNEILSDGEFGVEEANDGSRRLKIGDGVTHWLDLPYVSTSGGMSGIPFEVQEALNLKADKVTTYTKTEVDGLVAAIPGLTADVAGKANLSDVYTKSQVDTRFSSLIGAAPAALDTLQEIADKLADDDSAISALLSSISTKANTADVYAKTATYSKTEIDAALALKVDPSTVYTKTQTDTLLNAKADIATTYDKTTVDSLLSAKANAANVYDKASTYSKSEVDTALGLKANVANVYDKSLTYSKSEVDTALGSKADAASVYTKTESDTLLSAKADASSVYTKGASDALYAVKATTLAGYGIADAYTKTEVDTRLSDLIGTAPAALDTLQEIAAALQNDESVTAGIITTLSGKADQATTLVGYGITNAYTKGEVDTALALKIDASDVYTKTEINSSLSAKSGIYASLAGYGILDAYTKGEVDTLLVAKADAATTLLGYGISNAYTKTEVDTALGFKSGIYASLAGYGILDAYTKAQVDTIVSGIVPTIIDNSIVNNKLATVAALSIKGNHNATTGNVEDLTVAQVKTMLNYVFSDLTGVPSSLGGYGILDAYTKTEIDSTNYTKTQVDTFLSSKSDIFASLAGYGILDAYTKGETNTLLSSKSGIFASLSGYGILDAYTKTEVDSSLALKANQSTTYTKTEVDTKLADLIGTAPANLDTLQEIAAALQNEESATAGIITTLGNKADKSTTLVGYGITNAYTKTEVDAFIAGISPVVADNSITNVKLSQMAALTIKGNNGGGVANPTDLSVAQVKSMLSLAVADISGAAPTASPVFSGALRLPYNTLLAAGSTQGTASVVVATHTGVANGDGTNGIILPASSGSGGEWFMITNNGSLTFKVYPPVGSRFYISGIPYAINAPYVVQYKEIVEFFAGEGSGAYFRKNVNTVSFVGILKEENTPAFTGDITNVEGSLALAISNDAVDNNKLTNMPANTIKGNNTGASADPKDLTTAQVKTMLALTADDLTENTSSNKTNFKRMVVVLCATTGNITLSGLQTIDGYALSDTQTVLVKDQTNPIENGVWVASSGAWTRSPLYNTYPHVYYRSVAIGTGTVNSGREWIAKQISSTIVGTDPINFVEVPRRIASANSPLFTGIIRRESIAIIAAGATQGAATPIVSDNVYINSGTGGVILPPSTGGERVLVYNLLAVDVNVYPSVGREIDGLVTDEPLVLKAGTCTIFSANSNLRWYTLIIPANHVEGVLRASNMPALTGDVTSVAGAVSTTIANNAVGNAKLAQMATSTIKGNNGGSTADPSDLTAAQVKALLAIGGGDIADSASVGLDVGKELIVSVTGTATDGSKTLSGAMTLDGIAVSTGMAVLMRYQASAADNGVWIVNSSGAWTRSSHYTVSQHTARRTIRITSGTSFANTHWECDQVSPTIGTTALSFSRIERKSMPLVYCRAASIADVATLSGTMAIDGVALLVGDSVLLKDQTTATTNGVYLVASGAWSRHPLFTSAAHFDEKDIYVDSGTANGGTYWCCANKKPTIGTTSLEFAPLPFGTGHGNNSEQSVSSKYPLYRLQDVNATSTPTVDLKLGCTIRITFGVDGTGIRLPTGPTTASTRVTVTTNLAVANSHKIYPPSGTAFLGMAVDTPVDLTQYGVVILEKQTHGWYVINSSMAAGTVQGNNLTTPGHAKDVTMVQLKAMLNSDATISLRTDSYAAVAAAGTNQATATVLTARANYVNSGSGGVDISAATKGERTFSITNSLSTDITVYNGSAGAINGGTAGSTVTIPAGFTGIFVTYNGGTNTYLEELTGGLNTISSAGVGATGTNLATAFPLKMLNNTITSATAGTAFCVRLPYGPKTVKPLIITVANVSGKTITLFTDGSTQTLDDGALTSSMTIANRDVVQFILNNAGTSWIVNRLTPYHSYNLFASRNLSNAIGTQSIFGLNFPLVANTTYEFELSVTIASGATSHSLTFSMPLATATINSWRMDSIYSAAVQGSVAAAVMASNVGVSTISINLNGAGTNTWETFKITGVIRVLAAGTVNPSIAFSVAPGATPVVQNNSWIKFRRIGDTGVVSVGSPWA